MSKSVLTVTLPADEYRSLPIPYANPDGTKSKVGSCFVAAESLPRELKNWMKVNPRVPSLTKGDELKGPVATAIVGTLMERPDMMCLMNNGITLLVQHAEFTKAAGGKGELTLTLSDPTQHGVVNGGHTLAAVFQVGDDADRPDPWGAMVRLHVYEGLDGSLIPLMAEGLNSSMQVDAKSLDNLRGTFEKIKLALAGKTGADKIAYRQGDTQPVDVQFVLQLMAVLNISKFPDRKSHPKGLFGQPAKVLEEFENDQASGDPVYDRMLPRLHDILRLADEVQRLGVKQLPRLKVKASRGKDNTGRVAAPAHKNRPAYFAGGEIDGFFPVGWLFPVVAAFRTNIDRAAWNKGEMKWIKDPFAVLKATIEELCEIIGQEHIENKEKPAEVGRKEAAYRGCYGVLALELAEHS